MVENCFDCGRQIRQIYDLYIYQGDYFCVDCFSKLDDIARMHAQGPFKKGDTLPSPKLQKRGDEAKWDQDKVMYDLVPWSSVKQVAEVFTFGAARYGEESWKSLPNAKKRYFAACMRHLLAWEAGESHDQDSKLHHLAHASWNLLSLLWLEDNKKI